MIEITGTEKQVAWANDIRAKFIANAAKKAAYWQDEIDWCIEDEDTEGAEWAKGKLEQHTRLTTEILNEVSRAGWWIEYGQGSADYVIREFDAVKRGANFGGVNKIN